MSEEREGGVREKGRHEVKSIHLGENPAGAVTGVERALAEQNGGAGDSPFTLLYRMGAWHAEGLPAGGPWLFPYIRTVLLNLLANISEARCFHRKFQISFRGKNTRSGNTSLLSSTW